MLQNAVSRRIQSWLPLLVGLLAAAPGAAQVVVADAGDDLVLECASSDGATATLDALGSTVDGAPAVQDPDVDFLWTAPGIDFSDETSPTPSATFPLGTTTATLTVTHTDPATQLAVSAQDTVNVTVNDTTPPTLTLVANPPVLWPPNHKLHDIQLSVFVSDACDPDPDFTLTSVSSNEPDNGTGDGDTTNDIQGADLGTDDRAFRLRAERAGNGSGRVYTILGVVEDESGNSTNGSTRVVVPHDQRDAKAVKAKKAAEKAAKAAKAAKGKGKKK